MADDRSAVLLAFVALTSPRMPTEQQVLDALRDNYPVDPEPEPSPADSDKVFFSVPDGFAFASLMPAPIPWDDLEGPCETAWWWPEATEVMRAHSHHFIVSLMNGAGSPLERHVWLTKFVAAVCEVSDAVGVYWGSGTVVHSAEAFRGLAEVVSADEPFPRLWVDLRLQRGEGGYCFFSTGLEAFGLPEVEIDQTTWEPQEVLDFCDGIAGYLMQRGEAIGDGETIGRSAEEKIRVRHGKSMWEREGVVMKLEMS
jgi:hypothetical protein